MAIELNMQTPLTVAQLDNSDRIMVIDQNDTVVAITTLENLSEWIAGTLDIDSIMGLRDELNSKADSIHTHIIPDITNLRTELDTKLDASLVNIVGNTIQIKDRTITIQTGTGGGDDSRIPDMVTSGNYLRFIGTDGSIEERTTVQVRADLEINNVDNTSDLDKPVSTATQTALNDKLDKPAGNPSVVSFVAVDTDGNVSYTTSTGGTVNLSVDRTTSDVTIISSAGTDGLIQEATNNLAGVMSSSDKTKLDGIENLADVTDTANVYAALGIRNTGSTTRFLNERGTFTQPPVVTQVIPGTGGIGKGNILPSSPMEGELFALTQEDTSTAGGPYSEGIYCWTAAGGWDVITSGTGDGSGGTNVVANPPVVDSTPNLTSLGVEDTVYRILQPGAVQQHRTTTTIPFSGMRTNAMAGSSQREVVRFTVGRGFAVPYSHNYTVTEADLMLSLNPDIPLGLELQLTNSNPNLSGTFSHIYPVTEPFSNLAQRNFFVYARDVINDGRIVTFNSGSSGSFTAIVFVDVAEPPFGQPGNTEYTFRFDLYVIDDNTTSNITIDNDFTLSFREGSTLIPLLPRTVLSNSMNVMFDPDTSDTLTTNTYTNSFPGGTRRDDFLTTLGNGIEGLSTAIDWDGVINEAANGDRYIDVMLDTVDRTTSFTSGAFDFAVVTAEEFNSAFPNQPATTISLNSPDGTVYSFTSSTPSESDNNQQEVIDMVLSTINSNLQRPVNYTATQEGSNIIIEGTFSTTRHSGWTATVNNFNSITPGDFSFGSETNVVRNRYFIDGPLFVNGGISATLPFVDENVEGEFYNFHGDVRISGTTQPQGLSSIVLSNFRYNENGETVTVTVRGTPGISFTLSINNPQPLGWLTSGQLGSGAGTLNSLGVFTTNLTIPNANVNVNRTASIRATNNSDPEDTVVTLPIRQLVGHGEDGDLFVAFDVEVSGFMASPSAMITGGDAPYTLELFRTDPSVSGAVAVQTATITEEASPVTPQTNSFENVDFTGTDGEATLWLRTTDSGVGGDANVVIESETFNVGGGNFIDDSDSYYANGGPDNVVFRNSFGIPNNDFRVILTQGATTADSDPSEATISISRANIIISDTLIFNAAVTSGTFRTGDVSYEIRQQSTDVSLQTGTLNHVEGEINTQELFDSDYEEHGIVVWPSGSNYVLAVHGDLANSISVSRQIWLFEGENDGSDTSMAYFNTTGNTIPMNSLRDGLHTVRLDTTSGTTTKTYVWEITITLP